jgi:plasmid stabilization system protein ParE
MVEIKEYQVEISLPAQKRYQYEILSYLLENFSLERSIEIDDNITKTLKSLTTLPGRGRTEKYLEKHLYQFKFILHKESRNLEIKIIYYISEEQSKVYVTDFFPVKMNPKTIKIRN